MENEKNLIATQYSYGGASVSISFSDEPMHGSKEQLRSILLSCYTDQQNESESTNLTVDKMMAA